MEFGLSDTVLKMIREIFAQHPEVNRVQIFGSRAMGTYRDNSDIDLIIMGNMDNLLWARIISELEELPLPYIFDVQLESQLTHEELREHIRRFAKNLYIKNN